MLWRQLEKHASKKSRAEGTRKSHMNEGLLDILMENCLNGITSNAQ